jgi:hypothetical protein
MRITRIYADPEGESHFEEIEIKLQDAGEIGRLSAPHPVSSVIFRETTPDDDFDWHCAPQRQFIVLLDGAIEIDASDGEKRRFGGGDVLLVEDTTGRGHRTRTVDGRSRRSLFIPICETHPT